MLDLGLTPLPSTRQATRVRSRTFDSPPRALAAGRPSIRSPPQSRNVIVNVKGSRPSRTALSSTTPFSAGVSPRRWWSDPERMYDAMRLGPSDAFGTVFDGILGMGGVTQVGSDFDTPAIRRAALFEAQAVRFATQPLQLLEA